MDDGKPPLTYRDAGVDIDRATAAKDRIREIARATFDEHVLSEIGLFGGLYRLDREAYEEPVLVASTDGVGTKLKVAFQTGRHGTVGEDLVNHCVNDILVQGARPLFFLDYFASEGLPPETVAEVVSGVARGCAANGAALLGGETAEMPGFYRPGEYDLAGTIVGVVERKRVVDGARIEEGDLLVGLASNGLHTNGYSLARKVLFERAALDPASRLPELGESVADALLRVHRSYLGVLQAPLADGVVKGLAHVTGGGITDNLPRILPAGLAALVRRGSWPVPPIFALIARHGSIAPDELHRTFNMGVGMIVVVAPGSLERLRRRLEEIGESCYTIGEIVKGTTRVIYT
jgi:phosphoribosylformylglycinamidine cyclo-ligase